MVMAIPKIRAMNKNDKITLSNCRIYLIHGFTTYYGVYTPTYQCGLQKRARRVANAFDLRLTDLQF